tara:strand:+ start:1072 stop:1410 length:339 start_codon:yes stop_codon:yes gene_type:complete
MDINLLLVFFSGVSFIFYGIGSFKSTRMESEYKRWGYKDYRYLIGGLQLLGGIGLLIGLLVNKLLLISSAGLMLLMIIAVYVRFKIKDPLKMAMPALFYAIINSLIFYLAIN